jgi:aminopeptidase N
VKVLDSMLGRDSSILNIAGLTLSERALQRQSYMGAADMDPMAQKAYDYFSYQTYGRITYGKTASALLTLEGIIGPDTMQKAMHVYFMKYRFTHPGKEDFLATIEEVSGKNLRWYFDQVVYGTQVMDYEVFRVDSYPADWYEDKKDKKTAIHRQSDTVYQSYVSLHRKGEFVMPVEVEIKFDNGERVREHWDGQSRWTRFGYQKRAKAVSAEIDPEHTVQIDRNDFNNSYTVVADAKPANKLANYWLFVTEWLGQQLAGWAV